MAKGGALNLAKAHNALKNAVTEFGSANLKCPETIFNLAILHKMRLDFQAAYDCFNSA